MCSKNGKYYFYTCSVGKGLSTTTNHALNIPQNDSHVVVYFLYIFFKTYIHFSENELTCMDKKWIDKYPLTWIWIRTQLLYQGPESVWQLYLSLSQQVTCDSSPEPMISFIFYIEIHLTSHWTFKSYCSDSGKTIELPRIKRSTYSSNMPRIWILIP